MTNHKELLKEISINLKKQIKHLEYSYDKIKNKNLSLNSSSEEDLEVLESFASRFRRVIDIFLNKYIRTYILSKDPGFEGFLIDYLNMAEKASLIEDTELWLEIRSLRNIGTHEYLDEYLEKYYKKIKKLSPTLINLKEKI